MIEKLILTKVSSTNKKKDGTTLEGKFGTFYRVGIQTEQYPDKWINGFSNNEPEWKEGDEVELEISTEEYMGEEQLKFKIPNAKSLVNNALEKRIKKLEDKVFGSGDNEDVDANLDEVISDFGE